MCEEGCTRDCKKLYRGFTHLRLVPTMTQGDARKVESGRWLDILKDWWQILDTNENLFAEKINEKCVSRASCQIIHFSHLFKVFVF